MDYSFSDTCSRIVLITVNFNCYFGELKIVNFPSLTGCVHDIDLRLLDHWGFILVLVCVQFTRSKISPMLLRTIYDRFLPVIMQL